MRTNAIISFLSILTLFACSGGQETSSTDGSSKDKEEEKKVRRIEDVKIRKVTPKVDTSSGKATDPEKVKGSSKSGALFLYHERTACYGQCPVYTLRVHTDGKAELKAERFTSVDKGSYTGTVKKQKLKAIKEKARSIGFFQLDKVYDDEKVTDLPSRITRLKFDGKAHQVRNRYGGPDKLEALEKLIGGIVRETEWSPAPSDE